MISNSESKESKFLQKVISVFLSALLVVAFIPAVAFAGTPDNAGYASSQEGSGYKVDISGSTVVSEDNDGAGEDVNTADSENNSAGSANNESDNELNNESGNAADSTEDSVAVQSQGGQGQPEDAMSSWRFVNGQLETVYADEDNGVEMYSSRAGNGSPVAKGIDVSSWQGNINWNTVKNSGQVDFVIIRCGWGNNDSSQNDAYWLRNASECKRLGIPFGVYIYSYACNTSYAVSEADHVLAQLSAAGLSPSQVAYPIYLDLEQQSKSNNRPCGIDNSNREVQLSNGDLANIAQAFCNRIASAGYTPGIYANLNWWNNYLTSSVFNNYERWVAQYNSSCWYEGSYSLWQYASDGTIPGISGYVDMNLDYANRTRNISFASISARGMIKNTTGKALKPEVTITLGGRTLKEGTDYTLTFNNSSSAPTKAGSYDVKAKGTGSYEGEKSLGKMTVYDAPSLKNTSYVIQNVANSSLVLDAQGVHPVSGANIYAFQSNGGANQSWKLNLQSDGYYVFQNVANSSLVLDAQGAQPVSGANIYAFQSNGGLNQKWVLASQGNGTYRIINAANPNLVLDAQGSKPVSGAHIYAFQSNGGANQSWKLINR